MTLFTEGECGSKQYQPFLNKGGSGFKHDSYKHIPHEAFSSSSTIGSTRLNINNVLKIDQIPQKSISVKSNSECRDAFPDASRTIPSYPLYQNDQYMVNNAVLGNGNNFSVRNVGMPNHHLVVNHKRQGTCQDCLRSSDLVANGVCSHTSNGIPIPLTSAYKVNTDISEHSFKNRNVSRSRNAEDHQVCMINQDVCPHASQDYMHLEQISKNVHPHSNRDQMNESSDNLIPDFNYPDLYFDGSGDWNTFVDKLIAFIQGENVQDIFSKIEFLKFSLQGVAADYLNEILSFMDSMIHPFLEDFLELLFVLGERFYKHSLISTFFEAHQEEMEKIHEWAGRISQLGKQAFPELSAETLEELTAYNFYRQLHDRDAVVFYIGRKEMAEQYKAFIKLNASLKKTQNGCPSDSFKGVWQDKNNGVPVKLNTSDGKALLDENNGYLLDPVRHVKANLHLPDGSSVAPEEGPFFCLYGEFLPSVITDKALQNIESNSISSIHNQFHVTPMKQHEAHTKVKTVTLATIHNHESNLRDCCHPNNTFVNKCDKRPDIVSNQHGAVHISNSYSPNVVPETLPNLTHFSLTNQVQQCLVLAGNKHGYQGSSTWLHAKLLRVLSYILSPELRPSYCEFQNDQNLPLSNSGRVWDPGGIRNCDSYMS